MNKRLKPLLILSLSFFISLNVIGQNREKAQQAVLESMINVSNFKLNDFGEFFIQNYPEDIQEKLKTDRKIKYSLVMTYYLGNDLIEGEYFHLDKDLKVIGHLSMAEMMGITINMLENNEGFMKDADTIQNE
jgi:hypothetical protein